jgi:hypothetical protein
VTARANVETFDILEATAATVTLVVWIRNGGRRIACGKRVLQGAVESGLTVTGFFFDGVPVLASVHRPAYSVDDACAAVVVAHADISSPARRPSVLCSGTRVLAWRVVRTTRKSSYLIKVLAL